MTPQLMVLGLVAEEPGSVADIQRRLDDLFPASGVHKNSAHTNLPELAEKGHVRLVREGPTKSKNEYAPAEEGLRFLRNWVASRLPEPAQRDNVHGKLQFAEHEDLPAIIRMLAAEEEACQAIADKARAAMLGFQRTQAKAPAQHWREELSAILTAIRLADVALMWDDVAARRRVLRNKLEKIEQRFAQEAT